MRRAVPVAVRAAVVAALLSTAGCGLLTRDADEAASGTVVSGESDVSSSDAETVLGSVEASVQDRHPQGHLLTASSVEVRDRSVAVDVSLVNGSTSDIQVSSNRLYLLDDVGNTYTFSPPEQNESLQVAPGAELTGTLVFLGVLDPAATSLSLLANVNDPQEAVDLADRENQGGYPELVLDGLPLP